MPDVKKISWRRRTSSSEFEASGTGTLSSYGPLAYESTNIVLTAIQKVGKLDRAAIAAAVRATSGYQGILGFTPSPSTRRAM